MAREKFGSKLGIFFVLLGSISGASNVLGFSLITSKNGGFAFIIVHLICLFTLGFVMMLAEFFIGRSTQKNVVGALKTFANKPYGLILGHMIIIISFSFLLYYSVIVGKILSYLYKSISSGFNVMVAMGSSSSPSKISTMLFSFLFIILCCLIIMGGIRKGLERSYKILVIIMFSLIIILFIKTMTLSGASEGISLLLKPDFSKITFKAILFSLAYNFFSLSLGMGVMITMSSYFSKKIDLSNLVTYIIFAEIIIALLISMSFFSFYATYANNINFSSLHGTQDFIINILPEIINNLAGGYLVSILVVCLFLIAVLTSAIAIMECIVAYFIEEYNLERSSASMITTLIISILIFIFSMNFFTKITFFNKMNFFDTLIFFLTNILLPISGMLIITYLGWFTDPKIIKNEIRNSDERIMSMEVFIFLCRTIVPVLILMLLVKGCLNLIGLFSS